MSKENVNKINFKILSEIPAIRYLHGVPLDEIKTPFSSSKLYINTAGKV